MTRTDDADDQEQQDAAALASAIHLFAQDCNFVWGTGDVASLPPAKLPEIAFVGRSNVGKSSLINALTNRKTLARVSHTPGRTREINFFDLGGRLMLTDLPGYGYAKASRALAAEWQKLIFAYLRGRANLRRVALLIDSRRGVMEIDRMAMKLLDEAAVSYLLVATKSDALSPAESETSLMELEAEARKHTAAYPAVFATSSLKSNGLDALKLHFSALAL